MATKPKRRSGRGPTSRVPEWKKLEQDVADHYTDRAEKEPLVYHRFYDTHSANMFLPAQPGDHLVVKDGQATVIETKYSGKYISLVPCFKDMVDGKQLAFARLWTRAGANYVVVFQGATGFEMWAGALLYRKHVTGEPLNWLEATKRADKLNLILDTII